MADDLTGSLLAETLTAETATRIALVNNRDLQAAFNDLGLAEAASVGASIPPNPRFAIARIAGWSAHWLEQMEDNRIYRPDCIYSGPNDLSVPTIGQR